MAVLARDWSFADDRREGPAIKSSDWWGVPMKLIDEARKNTYGQLAMVIGGLWIVSLSPLTRFAVARAYAGVDCISIENTEYSASMWKYDVRNDAERLEEVKVKVTVDGAKAVNVSVDDQVFPLANDPRAPSDYYLGRRISRTGVKKSPPYFSNVAVPSGGLMNIKTLFKPTEHSREFWFEIRAKNLRPTTSRMLTHATSVRWVFGCLTLLLGIMALVSAYHDIRQR